MIQRAVTNLCDISEELPELIDDSADAKRKYDKALATTITRLKGEGVQASIVEKIAKGECSDELYKMLLAEGMLKACYSNIDRMKAQLNACQSLNRHLDVV
jgi:hypothetical protein